MKCACSLKLQLFVCHAHSMLQPVLSCCRGLRCTFTTELHCYVRDPGLAGARMDAALIPWLQACMR